MHTSLHKVYIPQTAKDNQYLLAELQVSEALLAQYEDQAHCYKALGQLFFTLCQQAGLRHVSFIANDKLPVVRYHTEAFSFQTQDQILFFYNPRYHEAQHSFVDPYHRARKISLLFLATGSEIRPQAATFHQQVAAVVQQFRQRLPLPDQHMKLRDHQHLSYDLFARQKGCNDSYGYKLRDLEQRYAARDVVIPTAHQTMNYAIVSLPFSRKIKEVLGVDPEQMPPWSGLFVRLEQLLTEAASSHQLNQIALVADGTLPLVRNSHLDKARAGRELRMLNFDLTSPLLQLQSHWQPDILPDTVHLVFAAGQDDSSEWGYGRFMNQVEAALKQLCRNLALQGDTDDCVIRFHQHLSYTL
ncbi:DUF3083 family protein [Rheinheimera texasensis]|uniref:DUF3083 family protein n=1 Tax=Rheinheimera texasensis TaxID=306205 RepID=UPI0032B19EEE